MAWVHLHKTRCATSRLHLIQVSSLSLWLVTITCHRDHPGVSCKTREHLAEHRQQNIPVPLRHLSEYLSEYLNPVSID